MVGRLVSLWDGFLAGAMLVSGGVVVSSSNSGNQLPHIDCSIVQKTIVFFSFDEIKAHRNVFVRG